MLNIPSQILDNTRFPCTLISTLMRLQYTGMCINPRSAVRLRQAFWMMLGYWKRIGNHWQPLLLKNMPNFTSYTEFCSCRWYISARCCANCRYSDDQIQVIYHDDVIKWKHFPRNWPLCGEFTGPRWIPRTKASDAELWCFLWSVSE